MTKELAIGARVKLIQFNGALSPTETVRETNNYYILIGKNAEVVKNATSEGIATDRVLIKFDDDVQSLGLHCHNEISNSLWIRRADLAGISG